MATTSGVTGLPLVEPLAEPLVEVVTVAQRRLAQGLSVLLAEEGATVDQFRVLRALAGGAGVPMGELAGALAVPHPSLTRVVDGLVDNGLAYRRKSAGDRRRIVVHLSRRGAQRLARLTALAEAHEEAVKASPEWAPLRDRLRALLAE